MLFPELVLDPLAEDGGAFLQIVQNVVGQEDNILPHYQEDLVLVRKLIQENKLQPDETKKSYLALLQGGDHVGATMEVNYEKMVETGTQGVIDDIIASGQAVNGDIFVHVVQRRNSLYMTIAMILDEMM